MSIEDARWTWRWKPGNFQDNRTEKEHRAAEDPPVQRPGSLEPASVVPKVTNAPMSFVKACHGDVRHAVWNAGLLRVHRGVAGSARFLDHRSCPNSISITRFSCGGSIFPQRRIPFTLLKPSMALLRLCSLPSAGHARCGRSS